MKNKRGQNKSSLCFVTSSKREKSKFPLRFVTSSKREKSKSSLHFVTSSKREKSKSSLHFVTSSKKGDMTMPELVFITLNILFFVLVSLFIYRSASGSLVYEESYAKNIALLLDSAKPDMYLVLDISPLIENAEENKYSGELVSVKDNLVKVQLDSSGSYSLNYFSNYSISSRVEGTNLVLEVKK